MSLLLVCATTLIINTSGTPFDAHDQNVLKQAKKRCGALYPKSPCVTRFFKLPVDAGRRYQVACGK